MAIPRPESTWATFKKTSAPHDLASGAVSSGSLIATGARFFASGSSPWGWFSVGMGALAFAIQCVKARTTLRDRKQRDAVHELQGCLHTLETVLLGPDLEPARRAAAGLRLTVHVPAGGGMLIQAVSYVGDQRAGGGKGRLMLENAGIVGIAYQRARLHGDVKIWADRRVAMDHDGFVAQMVNDYAFTPEGARRLNPATMAWVAVPIRNEGGVQGVLYCDAKDPEFFSASRKEDILHAVIGIAYYVGLRYS